MKLCGMVTEYNPLHNGHRFLIEQARQAGATHIVAVMSGCFVQRAQPALCSKFARARMAVENGVDLVIELPVQYAVASSERFAEGAVSILHALGIDMLAFGSECGDVAALTGAAGAVVRPELIERTRALYETGLSYPAARQQAVADLFGLQAASLLASPNNILGIDYIKALSALNAPVDLFTIKRKGAAHDSEVPDGGFASASFVRNQIVSGLDIQAVVPDNVDRIIAACARQGALSKGLEHIAAAVLYRLRGMDIGQLCALPGCADGLGNRLFEAAAHAQSVEQVCTGAKTKRYTMSRVRRAVVCALLGIDDSYYYKPPYARILAIGAGGEAVLKRIDTRAAIAVSHSIKALREMGGDAQKTADAEIRATDIWNLTLDPVGPRGHDYTQKLVRLPV